jgi:hypothetical protein
MKNEDQEVCTQIVPQKINTIVFFGELRIYGRPEDLTERDLDTISAWGENGKNSSFTR